MGSFADYKRRLVRHGKTFLLAFAIFYFSYHFISGELGAVAMIQLQQRVEAAQLERTAVHTERLQLRQRVDHMYANALDADLLDEQVRRLLGRAQKNEIVYLRPVE